MYHKQLLNKLNFTLIVSMQHMYRHNENNPAIFHGSIFPDFSLISPEQLGNFNDAFVHYWWTFLSRVPGNFTRLLCLT